MALAATALTLAACVQGSGPTHRAWMQPGQPIAARVAALLKEMTLEEKVAQLIQPWETQSPAGVYKQYNKTGLGSWYLTMLSLPQDGADGSIDGPSAASKIVQARNQMQHDFINRTRLGIPVSFIMESLHSGALDGTIFPMPINFGSSWNTTAMQLASAVVADEARAIGADRGFSPVVNVFPDPRYGRLQEGFSEDPTLTKLFGEAHLLGLTGTRGAADTYLERPDRTLVATVKHYAGAMARLPARYAAGCAPTLIYFWCAWLALIAYGMTSGGIDGSPADVSEQRLREMYLAPWEYLNQHGLLRSVMAAQNAVNGRPMHSNKRLLTGVLREEWNNPLCLVESDGPDVIGALQYGFHVVGTIAEAAVRSLHAGVDVDLGGTTFATLTDSVRAGDVSESEVDRAVTNALTAKFAAGLFEHPFTDPQRVLVLDSAKGRRLAREVAEQSLVLVKNEQKTLPVNKHVKFAVVGPLADDGDSHAGGYTNPGARIVTVKTAFEAAGADFEYAYGASPVNSSTVWMAAAVKAVEASDVAVVVVGDTASTCGEMFDRSSLDLPGGQLALLEAAVATKKPVVAVLINGRPATFGPGNTLLEKLAAVLVAWRPGEEGGTAVYDTIVGAVNPSGRLTQAWPRSVGGVWGPGSPYLYPYQGNHQGEAYAVDGASDSLFVFGWGLSYTSFELSWHTPPPATVHADSDGNLAVRVNVRNSGGTSGAAVAQCYFRDPVSPVVRLGSVQLWRWGRTAVLPPGGTEVLELTAPIRQLAYWNDGKNDDGLRVGWIVDKGRFDLLCGTSGFGHWGGTGPHLLVANFTAV